MKIILMEFGVGVSELFSALDAVWAGSGGSPSGCRGAVAGWPAEYAGARPRDGAVPPPDAGQAVQIARVIF